ncbi:MAG: hypothetical protein ONB33_05720, partial [candidate division KSB1 bacterium]|nr:hypothetical protein [candidate division KSB1 bacterium]
LIPKLSLAIFKGGGSAADLGTYGTGITAGVVISTVWKRLKHITIATTQQIAAHTSTGVISGAQRLSQSPTASSTEAALRSLTDGAEGSPGNWPFEGGRVENLVEGM